MMTEPETLDGRRRRLPGIIGILIVLLSCGRVLAGGPNGLGGTARHKVTTLSNLPADDAKRLLNELGLGTCSRLPGTNSLLITAEPGELAKATAILDVLDCDDRPVIRKVAPALKARTLPSNEQIADAVGGIAIGTFSIPPKGPGPRAIIDIHHGNILAIGPVIQLQDIILAIEIGPSIFKERRLAAASVNLEQASVADSVATGGAEAAVIRKPDSAGSPAVIGSSGHPGLAGQPVEFAKAEDSDSHTEPAKAEARIQQSPEAPAERQQADPADAPGIKGSQPAPVSGQPTQTDEDEVLSLEQIVGALMAQGESAAESADHQAEPTGVAQGQTAESVEPTAGIQRESAAKVESSASSPVTTDSQITAQAQPVAAGVEAGAEPTAVAQVGRPAGNVSYSPPEVAGADEVVKLNLPPKVSVPDLLGLVGEYLGLTYLYDQTKVTGDVTLMLHGKLRGDLRKRDLYPLLESVLKFKGFAMSRRGNIVTIVQEPEALKIDPALVDPNGFQAKAGDGVVTRVFELKHIDTASAENLLNNMQLTVGIVAIDEIKTLIITGYAYRMERIEKLLAMVDKPGEPKKFKFRQLRYTMAPTLAEKVMAMAEQLGTVSITIEAEPPAPTTPTSRTIPPRPTTTVRRITTPAQAAQTQQEVYLDADERTNRILMIGLASQLEIVDDLIDALDVEQQDLRTLEIYKIDNLTAEEVLEKLEGLEIIKTTYGTSSRLTGPAAPTAGTPGQAQPVPTRMTTSGTYRRTRTGADEEAVLDQPQVVVIASTNSLLVNATAEQHAQIKRVVEFIDMPRQEEEMPYRIYPLRNSSPDHLAQILGELVQEKIKGKDDKVETVQSKLDEAVTIVPDPNTFSLIVYASKKNQDWIESLVKQLDKRRPQVLIDVTLVEITKTDEFTYDLDLLESFPDLTGATTVADAILPSVTGRDRFIDFKSNKDGFLGFYGDTHINALLTAMQSKNYGRVLAKPKLLVNDNQQGTITTADIVYVEKRSSIPVSQGTGGTQTTLIETAIDYQSYEAGVTLDITPHISEGDLLRLDIILTRSDFRPTEDPAKPPNTTKSEVTTAVTVPDGSTIILGGMLKLNQNKGGSKVPILGDLPGVGGLFRSVNNTDTGSKLYVFVKGEIIRPADEEDMAADSLAELKEISERNRLAFEKHEKEFQDYQNWPGVKPKPVAPVRVLDAQ